MSLVPLITFKAGKCEVDYSTKPYRVKSVATPGYIYLFRDEFLHFCWRPRSVLANEPELDLLMMPADGHLIEYTREDDKEVEAGLSTGGRSPTNGRIIVLKFASSSQKHIFWLQSKPQHPSGDPSLFSRRDHKIIHVVNMLLNSQVIDVAEELKDVSEPDDENVDHIAQNSGSKNDEEKRPEGNNSSGETNEKQGASTGDMSAILQNFLTSLGTRCEGNNNEETKPFPSLTELLSPSNTSPLITQTRNESLIDRLLLLLPTDISLLMLNGYQSFQSEELMLHESNKRRLSKELKLDMLLRVLRSPQLCQSLDSLSIALRGGGLLAVSDALEVSLNVDLASENVKHDAASLSPIHIFLNGIKSSIEN